MKKVSSSILAVFFLMVGCADSFERVPGDEITSQPDDVIINNEPFADNAAQDDGIVPDDSLQPDDTVSPDNPDMPDDAKSSDDAVVPDNAVVPDDAPASVKSVSVSVTTATYNGEYSPKNVFAIWIEKDDGSYIKTLGAWAQKYKSKLQRWMSKSGSGSKGMTDAVTGASRRVHGTENVSWNLTDVNNQPLSDGIYNVYFELNETNGSSKQLNAQIQLGANPSVLNVSNTANFKDINISFVK